MDGKEKFSTSNTIFAENSFTPAAAWLYGAEIQAALAMLEEEGGQARLVGGAVRDTLLGAAEPAGGMDIDIATILLPQEVMARAGAHGFNAVPYAPQFGTVLVIINGKPLQITTLRQDVATDGRRATVRFCRDWAQDAARRDFTVNALSVDRRGKLYDYYGGLDDIAERRLRFIGEPAARIKEDYLRILRFFRFYAVFGRGRPDSAALRAIAALKPGLNRLSAERVWAELKKLLAAENPRQSLLWMRASGVLSLILPESEKWGIDALQGLLQNEQEEAGRSFSSDREINKIDYLLRLMAIIPPRTEKVKTLAARLRLSGAEKQRLTQWAKEKPIAATISETELQARLYAALPKTAAADGAAKPQAVLDALSIACANARVYSKAEDCRAFARLARFAAGWAPPHFPVSGADLTALGLRGASLGKALKELEKLWIESAFQLDKQALLKKL